MERYFRRWIIFTSLILGESHTGKTRSLSTLIGKSVLFNFDGPDNVSALRVPYREVSRLTEFWKENQGIEKIVVVNYTATHREVNLLATPSPKKDRIQGFIEDLNSVGGNLEKIASSEGQGNLILETLAPFGDEVLDFIVASQGRSDTQIQDYKFARYKLQALLGSMMGYGLNVIVTGHLQSEKDEITGRGRITPQIWGKDLPNSIPKMFGEVFQSLVVAGSVAGSIKYQWMTRPDPGGFIGFLGTRKSDNLPKYIDQDFGYLEKGNKGVKK